MLEKKDLIYDLIFSETDDYKINIADYIDDIYGYDEFVENIKIILKKSRVKVKKSEIIIDSKTAIWYLKVIK